MAYETATLLLCRNQLVIIALVGVSVCDGNHRAS